MTKALQLDAKFNSRGMPAADDLSCKLSSALLDLLERDNDVLSTMKFRTVERWLYGYVTRALATVIGPSDFILTEVPVPRGDGNGRIDFVFTYGGYLYLLELKSTGCGITGKDARSSISASWGKAGSKSGVVGQLDGISVDDVANQVFEGYATIARERGIKGIVRLPMLVICYFATTSDQKALDALIERERNAPDGESLMEKRHRAAGLDSCFDKKLNLADSDRIVTAPGRREGKFRATFGYGVFMGHRSL